MNLRLFLTWIDLLPMIFWMFSRVFVQWPQIALLGHWGCRPYLAPGISWWNLKCKSSFQSKSPSSAFDRPCIWGWTSAPFFHSRFALRKFYKADKIRQSRHRERYTKIRPRRWYTACASYRANSRSDWASTRDGCGSRMPPPPGGLRSLLSSTGVATAF